MGFFDRSPALAATILAVAALGLAEPVFAQADTSSTPPLPAEPSVPIPPPSNVQPGLLSAGGTFDSVTPDIVMTVRAGVQVSPAYLGSSKSELGPDFSARLDYLRFPGGFEYGSSRSVGFRQGWGLQGSVRYLGERNSKDYDEIKGLDDVPWSSSALASAMSSATGGLSLTCGMALSGITPGLPMLARTRSPIRSRG